MGQLTTGSQEEFNDVLAMILWLIVGVLAFFLKN
jgi:hypothetical protein